MKRLILSACCLCILVACQTQGPTSDSPASVLVDVQGTDSNARANPGGRSVISIPGFADPVSCMTHLLAALVALVAGILLVLRFHGPALYRVGLVIFVFSAVFMFSMSGVYHLLGPGGSPRYVLRHLDHAAIWVMIAGTFTPVHLMLFRGWARWGVLAFVWTAAINGIVLKSVFFEEFPKGLGLVLYLGLGWVGLFSIIALVRRLGIRTARFMVCGGLSYTVGAVVEFLKPPFLISGVVGPHELFHLAVIIGVIYHWRFVRLTIDLAGRQGEPMGDPDSGTPVPVQG
jgi:channel protein (hemolysin III family)